MDPKVVLLIVGVVPASAGACVASRLPRKRQIATKNAQRRGEAPIHATRLVNIRHGSHGSSLVQPLLNESGRF